jgi:hypothetical protein
MSQKDTTNRLLERCHRQFWTEQDGGGGVEKKTDPCIFESAGSRSRSVEDKDEVAGQWSIPLVVLVLSYKVN